MIGFSHRLVMGVTIAMVIIALATTGGYRLASPSGSPPHHVRLAIASFPQTWVSTTGADTNTGLGCPRAAPCRSIAAALSVTLPGGELDVIDPYSNFGNTVTITQAVTIDGLGGGKATVVGSVNGINVQAGPNDVVILRHLQLSGLAGFVSGSGIRFYSGRALMLDDVAIDGFPVDGVQGTLSAGGSTLGILNSRIYNNGSAGVAMSTTAGTVHTNISRSFIENNYYGVISGDGSVLDLAESVISGNTSIGLGAQTFGNLSSLVHATHDQIDNNPYAVWENQGAGNAQIIIWLSDNDVVNNTYAIYGNFGGTLAVFSFGNNRLANNTVNGAPNGTATQT